MATGQGGGWRRLTGRRLADTGQGGGLDFLQGGGLDFLQGGGWLLTGRRFIIVFKVSPSTGCHQALDRGKMFHVEHFALFFIKLFANASI